MYQKIFDYLDEFSFVNEQEVEMAVGDYFMQEEGVCPSYADLVYFATIADDYMQARGLLLDFNQL